MLYLSYVDAEEAELLGLSDTDAKLLSQSPRGHALWKVGTRSFLVEHRLSPAEVGLVDTGARMRPLPLAG